MAWSLTIKLITKFWAERSQLHLLSPCLLATIRYSCAWVAKGSSTWMIEGSGRRRRTGEHFLILTKCWGRSACHGPGSQALLQLLAFAELSKSLNFGVGRQEGSRWGTQFRNLLACLSRIDCTAQKFSWKSLWSQTAFWSLAAIAVPRIVEMLRHIRSLEACQPNQVKESKGVSPCAEAWVTRVWLQFWACRACGRGSLCEIFGSCPRFVL